MGASLRRNGYTVNLQEGAAPDEDDGAGLDSTGEADNLAWGWSQDIPIPFKEFGYNLPEPGLVQWHYVYSTEQRFCIPYSGNGLAQPLCTLLKRSQPHWKRAFTWAQKERALRLHDRPEIFNTDQGSQYTGAAFTGALKDHGIRISMDGKGRAMDNIMVERLWRTLKYEDILRQGLHQCWGSCSWALKVFWLLQQRTTSKSLSGQGHHLKAYFWHVHFEGGSVMISGDRVVLASPELRMAPPGSDNLNTDPGTQTKQHTLNPEDSGLDIGVHYNLLYIFIYY